MYPRTSFPNGFADGIALRNMPLLQLQQGDVYFLSNSAIFPRGSRAGSDSNRGTFNSPFATLAGALTHCTAGQGDVIFVGPGHAETVSNATSLALNVSGVAIIGLGAGSLRPTFTLNTANTANIPVTAANVSIQNCLFIGNFLSIASLFTATGTTTPTDFLIDKCEFRDTSTVLGFLSIFTGNATANSCDGFTFTNNVVNSLSVVSPTVAITLAANADRVNISNNQGTSAITATTQGPCLLAAGASNLTNFVLSGNRFYRPNTSTTIPMGVSSSSTACTGLCSDNYFWGLATGTGIWISTGTKLGFVNNYSPITGAADKSALINPVAV